MTTTIELATTELTTTELATTTELTETSAEIAETSEELTEAIPFSRPNNSTISKHCFTTTSFYSARQLDLPN